MIGGRWYPVPEITSTMAVIVAIPYSSAEGAMNDDQLTLARHRLVRELEGHGITDGRVLEAIARVPRHRFVPAAAVTAAYDDSSLPIGEGQTISQPFIVALMTELLRLTGSERVLEIGTGSGYQTAILSELAREVYTIERLERLASRAREQLEDLGCSNVHFIVGDGTFGLAEHAPYDGIIVTAASPGVPGRLLDQLAPRGRLVIPVGDRHDQVLRRVTRLDGHYHVDDHCAVRFVPLVGEHAWPEPDA